MTTLVGLDAVTDGAYTTTTRVTGGAGTGTRFYSQRFVARRSGTADTMSIKHGDLSGGVERCKMLILDSAFTVLGQTGVVASPSSGASRLSGALDTSVSIVVGRIYYLGIYIDQTNDQSRYTITGVATTTDQFQSDTGGSYDSPPATSATLSGMAAGNQPQFSINASGTASSGTDPDPYSIAKTVVATAAQTWTVDLPDHNDGDLLLFHFVTNSNANSQSGNYPTGVTAAQEIDISTDSTALLLKKIASSDGLTLAFTNLWDATESGTCTVTAVSGADQTNPINASASTTVTGGTSVAGPSITPNVDGCRIMQFVGTDPGTGTYAGTPDSSPAATELFDWKDDGSLAYQFIQHYLQTSQAAISLDATGLTSDDYSGIQIAIKPVSSGAVITLNSRVTGGLREFSGGLS